jgi:hypothetical protein
LYYPDEVVLRLVGRDCGLCRNPFNFNKKTLHIWIEKTDPKDVTSKEFARHEDSEISRKREQSSNEFETMPSTAEIAKQNAISAGDAFDFAELHYKQSGNELLQTINKELHLHIGKKWSFYKNKPQSPFCSNSPNHNNHKNPINQSSDNLFSFFRAPITNTKPHKTVSLLQIYNAIKGDYYKAHTEKLRAISDVTQARKFKAVNFDYCTFSGIFTTRNDKALIKHSGLLCLDFDHLSNIETLFNQLLKDDYFDTQLLFRSPSGDGLKWVISISPHSGEPTVATDREQLGGFSHSEYFAAVANYILQTYGITVDKSGRDISRACFLPHDPQAYINPVIARNEAI